MVNYDTQAGYSVSSFQSAAPQQLLKAHGGGGGNHHHHSGGNRLEMSDEEMPAAAALLPATTLGSNGLTLQSHLLVPSTSILTIHEVNSKHAGNYTCAPSNARPGTITIHVLRGKLNIFGLEYDLICTKNFLRFCLLFCEKFCASNFSITLA